MADLQHIWQADARPDPALTCGSWRAERDAEDHLARFLANSELFHVHRQVVGRPLWTHHFQAAQEFRADLLLIPTERLRSAGWDGGAVVIEVKRSGEKIGPGCNQLLDYLNSIWRLPDSGLAVMPEFGFLFPAEQQHGPLASVMAHQHIGTACFRGDRLDCYCGESRVLSLDPDGTVQIGRLDFGRKAGSR